MYRYAQILNNKAYWLMEDEMPLDELYKHKFCKNDIHFVDITNNPEVQEGWDYDGITFSPPVIATSTLAELKAIKWQTIKSTRDTLEQSGVPYMGKILDSDTLSVQRITIAVQAAQAALSAGQPLTLDWTTQDNTVLTMTAQEVCGIPAALAMHSDSLHQIARGLRERIDAAETKEEIDVVTWPV